MTPNLKIALTLLVAFGGVSLPACGEEDGHEHDHPVAAATSKASSAQSGDAQGHDAQGHDHDTPATTAPGTAAHADPVHSWARREKKVGHDHGDGHDTAHAEEVKLTAEAVKVARIRVEPVKKHAIAATFTAPGRVAFNADAMAHVGSLVSGRVTDIKARVGDVVRKGDELLVVESAELGQSQSEYLQKRADLAVTLAAVEPAQHAYERARKLYDANQGIALGEVQKRRSEFKAAEGNVLAAKSRAVAALNRLLLLGMTKEEAKRVEDEGMLNAKLSVRAPIAGRVIEREVTLGELVGPEKERLMVLADMETVWLLAEVPEARLPLVTTGSPARVQIAAVPNQRFEGTVAQIAPALNPDTRAGRARIDVPNPAGTLRPGMFASVVLTAAAQGNDPVLAVPDEAVMTVEGSPVVFVTVEGEPNTFAKRGVTIGQPVSGMVPVLSGLKEGEPVVVGGTFILKAELGKSEAKHQH